MIHAAKNPRAHRLGEPGIHLVRKQGANREAERDREPDIAEVERRRMEGEAGILKKGLSPCPRRRRIQPRERIRGDEQESVETERQAACAPERGDKCPALVRREKRQEAPAAARIVTHISIEPSWFPHAPATL
jgi:hypothetical protein